MEFELPNLPEKDEIAKDIVVCQRRFYYVFIAPV
jgi:hypothetical protein